MADASIHGLVTARACADPDLVAVDDGTERLSFAELDYRSDAVARRLRAHGVGPGMFVAVCLERSALTVVTLLAILKTGGAYVALDPAYPRARLRWILADISPGLVLASRALAAAVPAGDIPSALAEQLGTTGPVPHARGVAGRPAETGLAFITYTSGTTGRPKGVMAEHRAVACFMGVIARYLAIGPGTRFLQFYPLTWETQALELYAVLSAGGTVVVPPAGLDTSGPALVRFLRDARVSAAMLPPALLAELTEEPPLPGLRTLAYIGEPCRPAAAERWGSGRRLVNLYGPTEVTVAATASDERRPGEAPPIGKPLEGRELHILDPMMRPVPDGEPGELYVGGPCLARGYWGLPELTARQFPPDPFSDRPGARLYRTGDRVRCRADGNLEYIGRVDDQMKVRGQRVERGEVESVLAACPGVRSCAVVVQGEGPDGRLVAFVAGVAGIDSRLPAWAADRLPPVMVPSIVVRLDSLPLSQHGKIDLDSLRAHPVEGTRTAFVPPLPGAQADLARIWQDVLGIARVGAGDGFRALGGTSLQAVRTLNRIRDGSGVALTVPELTGPATLAEVAALIAAGPGERAALPPLTRTSGDGSYLASLHQRRLWSVCRMKPAACVAYNEVSALRLTGHLDLPALRDAIQDLTGRHEALRSSLHLDGADLRVDVASQVTAELAVQDLTGRPDPAGAAASRAAELGAEPFDLARPPLLRAVLLRTAAAEQVLVLVTHHTVADGLSLDVLDRDLARCYAARSQGRSPAGLPGGLAGGLRPRDHAAWQRAAAGHPAVAAGVDHWRDLLAGAPTQLRLPGNRPRPPSFSYRGGRVNWRTGAGLRQAVARLAQDGATTPYVVCLVAFAILVARLTGQRDVLIGSPFAGRPDRDAEDVIGFFTNTVVMRVSTGGDPVPLELLGRVDAMAQQALEHQYVAFGDVVRAAGGRPGASGQPLVQVVLAYQGPLRPHAGLAGTRATPLLVDNGTATADLSIEVNEVADELVVVLAYSADLFGRPAAERLLAQYAGIVRELTARTPQEVTHGAFDAPRAVASPA